MGFTAKGSGLSSGQDPGGENLFENDKAFFVDPEGVDPEEAGEAEEEVSLKKALEEEKEKAEKYLANWQRTQADFENFRKRSEQERIEQASFANAGLICELLPVIDDLERALENIPDNSADVTWGEGMKLIHRKLQAVLQAVGLTEIEAEGENFDPHLHEAMLHGDGEEGKVVEVLQKGYKLHERVIRPSKVKVGKG